MKNNSSPPSARSNAARSFLRRFAEEVWETARTLFTPPVQQSRPHDHDLRKKALDLQYGNYHKRHRRALIILGGLGAFIGQLTWQEFQKESTVVVAIVGGAVVYGSILLFLLHRISKY